MVTAPFDIPYSFTTDVNGNGSFQRQFANDFWYQTVISGLGKGNITWTLKRNGVFLRPALGPAVVMNAGVCAPGTRLDLSVSGANANSAISGTISGNKNIDPSTLVQTATDASSSFTQFQAIATTSGSFVTGTSISGPGFEVTIPVAQASSFSLGDWVEVLNTPGGSGSISQPGRIISIDTIGNTILINNGNITAAAGDFVRLVNAAETLQTQPALWQSPNAGNGNGAASIGSGAQLTLINAPNAGVIIRLFSLNLDIIGAAGSFFDLQTLAGANIGYRFDASFTRSVSVLFFGRSVGNNGIQITNSGANPSGPINFGIEYSSGTGSFN